MSLHLDTLHHVGLIVRDMETMAAFYEQLTGVKPTLDTHVGHEAVARQTGLPDPRMRVVVFQLGPVALELTEFLQPASPGGTAKQVMNTLGTKHLAFKVKDAEAAFEALRLKGIPFVAPAVSELGDEQGALKGLRYAAFHDPEGNLLEIAEDPSATRRALNVAFRQ